MGVPGPSSLWRFGSGHHLISEFQNVAKRGKCITYRWASRRRTLARIGLSFSPFLPQSSFGILRIRSFMTSSVNRTDFSKRLLLTLVIPSKPSSLKLSKSRSSKKLPLFAVGNFSVYPKAFERDSHVPHNIFRRLFHIYLLLLIT